MKNDIEALRGFANEICDYCLAPYRNSLIFEKISIKYGLLDKDGNKTEILTGSKDLIKDNQRKENFAIIGDILKSGLEQFRGWTKEDLHRYLKESYLVPIFVRDDSEFRDYWDMLYTLRNNVSMTYQHYEKAKDFFIKNISIMDATESQAKEYLADIRQFCVENGVRLTAPKYYEDL